MHSFRPLTQVSANQPLDPLAIAELIDDAMRPGQFFVAPELRLTWIAARTETIPWEIFRGRLVDAAQTREQKTFLSWHVVETNETAPATESTISVKFDLHARQIHITRGLLAHVWEGFDAGGGVIESRETMRWTRELVGTITLEEFNDSANLHDELICLIWQGIVGTSRLPLTSVEAPLPAFSFGQLHYVYREDAPEGPMSTREELRAVEIGPAVGAQEMVKQFEFMLRRCAVWDSKRFLEMRADPTWQRVHGRRDGASLWRELFNGVSLSPNTSFVNSALASAAIALPRKELTELDSHLLRQLCRHLTAYDLVTFHHRGANYPDALLLNEVLRRFALTAELFSETFGVNDFEARLRRRALRQACLIRRHYEGHLVPDAPTSPGENARVLPEPHLRVPEEQLSQPHRRRRHLFVEESLETLLTPNARHALELSVRDLEHLDERVEMGLGLFIDRPLGYAKAVGEPDLTPLLAHEAFSPAIARRRWQELKKLCAELAIPCDAAALDPLFENGPWPAGLPHAQVAECPRPTAALCDVRKVADDFVILRTRPGGLRGMLDRCDIMGKLRERYRLQFVERLCVQGFDEAKQPVLVLYDEKLCRRVEMRIDVLQGFTTRAGVEYPKAGLHVLRVWEDTDDPKMLARREMESVDAQG